MKYFITFCCISFLMALKDYVGNRKLLEQYWILCSTHCIQVHIFYSKIMYKKELCSQDVNDLITLQQRQWNLFIRNKWKMFIKMKKVVLVPSKKTSPIRKSHLIIKDQIKYIALWVGLSRMTERAITTA